MSTTKPLPEASPSGSQNDLELPEQIYIRDRDPLVKARAIQQCLEYLCYEAEAAQLPLAVHLIGAAAEHLADVVGATAKPSN